MGETPAIERAAFRKVVARLLLPIAILSFVNAIDRMNVSFAGSALSRDLALTPSQFGTGVSLFFVAYLIFQYPHALLLRRWGIRRWLLLSVSVWGLSSLAMAYVQSAEHFYAVRFLLGMAEAGFAPGMTWLIGQWTPPRMRGRALAIALVAVPAALVVGGPLCGFLLGMDNPMDMPGWRWMFFASAWPNFLLAVVAWFWFVDRPADARWLGEDEKRLLADSADEPARAGARWSLERLRDLPLWTCASIWLCVMTGSYALVYWLPQLVRQLAPGEGEFLIGTLSALPQAGLAAGLLVNAWHSDRTGERVWHVAAGALAGGLALIVAAMFTTGMSTLVLLVIAGFGVGAAQGVFWTLPAAFGIGRGKPPVEAIALISMFGTAGGIIGPYILGALVERSGNFVSGIVTLATLLLVAAVVLAAARRRVHWRGKDAGA